MLCLGVFSWGCKGLLYVVGVEALFVKLSACLPAYPAYLQNSFTCSACAAFWLKDAMWGDTMKPDVQFYPVTLFSSGTCSAPRASLPEARSGFVSFARRRDSSGDGFRRRGKEQEHTQLLAKVEYHEY